jgi:hypothetical protein
MTAQDVPLVMNIPSFAVDIIPAEVSDADLKNCIPAFSRFECGGSRDTEATPTHTGISITE